MSAGWLVRTAEGRLARLVGDALLPLEGVPPLPGLPASRIAFAGGRRAVLAAGDGDRVRAWRSDDGDRWLPVPPLACDWDRVGLFADPGAVTCVAPGLARIGTPEGWRDLPLPEGAGWIGPGRGGWWAVGSLPVEGADERVAAAWRPAGAGRAATRAHPGLVAAMRLRAGGGFDRFLAVDARAEPVVLASQCAWFLDDPSGFLHVLDRGGRLRSRRVPDRAVARLDREADGTPVAFTDDGERWRWRGRWRRDGWAAGIRAALGTAPARVHVAAAEGRVRALAWSARGGPVALGSEDGGRRWFRVERPELEFLAAHAA